MEDKLLERVLVYGDIHLCSKNYGSHKEYPKESLEYFRNITNTAKEMGVTTIIGLGDFTYGRFNTLEFRKEVELELEKQSYICNGKRYELKGNHDRATYGMTEYEYYVERGLLKRAENLRIGNLNISMVNYGQAKETEVCIEEGKTNVILMHDYFKFEDTMLPDYGKAIYLDDYEKWFGADYIIGGHIHNHEAFSGKIIKDGRSYESAVLYLGCPCRPAYREGHMQSDGWYVILESYESGKVVTNVHSFDLWPIEESFALMEREEQEEHLEQKRVDVTDVVRRLDSHERVIGEPEEVIMAMSNIDIKYRNKAVELLREGQA